VHIMLQLDKNASPQNTAGPPAMPLLAPKIQKIVATAAQALRSGNTADARQPLEEASHLAPNHPYVLFLYGLYFSQNKNTKDAEDCWKKAINVYPRYVDALLYLGDTLVRDNGAADAVPYLNR